MYFRQSTAHAARNWDALLAHSALPCCRTPVVRTPAVHWGAPCGAARPVPRAAAERRLSLPWSSRRRLRRALAASPLAFGPAVRPTGAEHLRWRPKLSCQVRWGRARALASLLGSIPAGRRPDAGQGGTDVRVRPSAASSRSSRPGLGVGAANLSRGPRTIRHRASGVGKERRREEGGGRCWSGESGAHVHGPLGSRLRLLGGEGRLTLPSRVTMATGGVFAARSARQEFRAASDAAAPDLVSTSKPWRSFASDGRQRPCPRCRDEWRAAVGPGLALPCRCTTGKTSDYST